MTYRRTTYTIRFNPVRGLWKLVLVLMLLNIAIFHFGVWMDCNRGFAPYDNGPPLFEWAENNLQRIGTCDE